MIFYVLGAMVSLTSVSVAVIGECHPLTRHAVAKFSLQIDERYYSNDCGNRNKSNPALGTNMAELSKLQVQASNRTCERIRTSPRRVGLLNYLP